MDWQLLLVIGLVTLAVLYLGRQALRTWRGKSAGCGSCKCPSTSNPTDSAAETLIPLEAIRLRRRR